VPVCIERKSSLSEARNKALSVSRNMGRPPENWEIREESGVRLDPLRFVEDFNFVSGVRLFLTLAVGSMG